MIIEYHEDQIIVLMKLPPSVSEAVTINEDGTKTIILNESLPDHKRAKAYQHALYHIDHDDFSCDNVQLVESFSHMKGII